MNKFAYMLMVWMLVVGILVWAMVSKEWIVALAVMFVIMLLFSAKRR